MTGSGENRQYGQGKDGRSLRRWPLLVLAGLLLAGSAVVWLFTADLGVFRPQIERLVTDLAGRTFRIGGELDIELGRETLVVAEDVSVANAEWAADQPLLDAGRVEIRFDLWSIFRGPLVVGYVDIDEVTVRLEKNTDGAGNWQFAPPRSDGGPGPGIRLRHVDIDAASLRYDNPRRAETLVVELSSVDQHHRGDDFLEFAASGSIGDRRIEASGRAGTWDNLLAAGEVEYEVDARLDTFTLHSEGRIDSLVRPSRPSLVFSAQGPDIDDLTLMLGLGDDAEGVVDVEGSLQPTDDGPLELRLVGTVGRAEIDARGTASDLRSLDDVDVSVEARAPDFGLLLGWLGIDGAPRAPFTIEAALERRGPVLRLDRGRVVVGETVLDASARMPAFPAMDDANIEIGLSGDDIARFRSLFGLPGAATGPFSASAAVAVTPGGGEQLRLSVDTSMLRLQASGPLGPAPTYGGSRLELNATITSLADMAAAFTSWPVPDGALGITGALELTDEGVSIRDPVVLSLDGTTVRVDGALLTTPGLTGSAFELEITGASLGATVESFGGGSLLPRHPYAATGRLAVDAGLRFDGFEVEIGPNRLLADGLLVPAPGIAGSRFEIRARGDELELLLSGVDGPKPAPGEFEFEGVVGFAQDAIELDGLALDRPEGHMALDARIGMPISERHIEFGLTGRGDDVRALLHGTGPFEPFANPFTAAVHGRLDGALLAVERFEVTIGDASATASGELHLSERLIESGFETSGRVPSLASLGTVDGRSFRDLAVEWSASVANRNGVVTADRLRVKVGQSDIGGMLQYTPGDVPRLAADVEAGRLVYGSLFEPEAGTTGEAHVERVDRLIPDVAIPFEAMRRYEADVIANVDVLELGRITLRNLLLDAELADGVLTVDEFDLFAPGGRLGASGRLDPVDNGRLSLRAAGREFSLGLNRADPDRLAAHEFDVAIDAAGANLRSLAASANGAALVYLDETRIDNNRFLGFLYGDLLDGILRTINPFAKTRDTTLLECSVVPLAIDEGLVRFRPGAIFRTDRIRITLGGSINLATEALDLNVRTTPRSGLTLSAGELLNPYVRIVGTLTRPTLGVDEKGVLLSGGAAVATGGLSILAQGVWDRLNRSADPCAEMVEQAMKELGGRLPDAEALLPDPEGG